ncbi:MAG: hypothetical protein NTZ22_08580 [Hyphomicrobiales bacterium]|nr:hypothetical protein [Hyphomicrobiales bacterium]
MTDPKSHRLHLQVARGLVRYDVSPSAMDFGRGCLLHFKTSEEHKPRSEGMKAAWYERNGPAR